MNAKNVPATPTTNISFDTGIREYTINGVPIKVNMNDNGIIRRLSQIPDDLSEMLAEYEERGKQLEGRINVKSIPMTPGGEGPAGVDFSALSEEDVDAIEERTTFLVGMDYAVDCKIKALLAKTFCVSDDAVNSIFQGVSVLALDQDGNTILNNFMRAIYPLIEEAKSIEAKEVSGIVGDRAARRLRNRQEGAV